MSIHPCHLKDLEASGLSQQQIKAAALYSESDPSKISELLNWNQPAKNLGPCLVFPFFGVDGVQTGYVRLKPSQPRTTTKDGKTKSIKYEAPRGETNHTYFAPQALSALADPSLRLLITEGEKKALKADQEGFPTIGLSGVWAWQQKRETDKDGQKSDQRLMIPDLQEIDWNGREVVIAFDSDAATNSHILLAEKHLEEALRSEGAKIAVLRLPAEKDDEKVGLDDYLLVHAPVELEALVDEAVEVSQLDSVKPICQRIDRKIDEGPTHVFLDEPLLRAIASVSIHDQGAFSAICAHLKSKKIAVRDYKKTLKPFVDELLKQIPPVMTRPDSGGYFVEQGKICRKKETMLGPQIISLCNFNAQIISEMTLDDGAEKHTFFEITGELSPMSGLEGDLIPGRILPAIEVPAGEFNQMNWVAEKWGSDPTIYAGERNQLAPAIQCLSDKFQKERRHVYSHLGWIQDGSRDLYLHAGGIIGEESSVSSLSVSLDGPLKLFNIVPLPKEITVKECLTRVLRFLDKTDESEDNDELTCEHLPYVLLATVFRSVICTSDFGIHVCGPTGVFKSELAALAQQFFGIGLDARHLPGSWSSTANSNESLAFQAKDALLVIDDFAPTGNDSSRLHRDADRLFRNQGNNAGRGRARIDGTRLPERPPRGLILSTGEDIPNGHSLRARSLIFEIQLGTISVEWLSERQRDAQEGIYAGCLHAFLSWLAPQRRVRLEGKSDIVKKTRAEFSEDGLHARTPGIVAELLYGFHCFSEFAMEFGAIDDEEREKFNTKCRQALLVSARIQADYHLMSEPAEMFINYIAAVLTSGRAHLCATNGEAPAHKNDYGWQQKKSSNDDLAGEKTQKYEWVPKGNLIGWIDEDGIYLEGDAAFAAVNSLAREQGASIPTAVQTLWKRLKEKNFLQSFAKSRCKVQKTINDSRKWVIHLRSDALGVKEENDSIL
jgi:hypothetical protein